MGKRLGKRGRGNEDVDKIDGGVQCRDGDRLNEI